MRHFTFVVLLVASVFSSVQAQDIHFSQYLNSPMNLGPGMAGVFGGDVRFTGNYRNQWRSVPVPYTTFSGVVENKFYHKRGFYDRFFTGGLMVNYDRQGDLRLTSIQIGVPMSYTLPLSKRGGLTNNFLTLGIQPMFGQRAFGTSKWTFDEQFIDCFYDPGAAITENGLIANNSLKYFDLSSGINYRWQAKVWRSKLDLGFGYHHMNRPNHDFWQGDNEVRLQSRYAFYGSGLFQIRPKADVVVQALHQWQGAYRQTNVGGGVRFHLNQQPYHEFALQVGVNYRNTYYSALIPHVEAHWRTWTLGLSYDINNFTNGDNPTVVNNRRGGPEVALIYRIYKVKPLAKFKSCPII